MDLNKPNSPHNCNDHAVDGNLFLDFDSPVWVIFWDNVQAMNSVNNKDPVKREQITIAIFTFMISLSVSFL